MDYGKLDSYIVSKFAELVETVDGVYAAKAEKIRREVARTGLKSENQVFKLQKLLDQNEHEHATERIKAKREATLLGFTDNQPDSKRVGRMNRHPF